MTLTCNQCKRKRIYDIYGRICLGSVKTLERNGSELMVRDEIWIACERFEPDMFWIEREQRDEQKKNKKSSS